MNMKETYIVAGSRPWNRRVFYEVLSRNPGRWAFVSDPSELTPEFVQQTKPRYLFFLHWSWRVAPAITDYYECVCFHMTDLPYGRGGSPLQNLILRGYRQTKLSALRMTDTVDAGPIYLKADLCLEGNAEEIYIRATLLAAEMIEKILRERPEPVPQSGDVTVFHRRAPRESEIPALGSLRELYDFIRMLDATGYPRAFRTYGGFRYEFSRAGFYDGQIRAEVTITSVGDPSR